VLEFSLWPDLMHITHVNHSVKKAISVPEIPTPSAILSLLLYPPPVPISVGVGDVKVGVDDVKVGVNNVEVGVDDVEVDIGVGEVGVDVGFSVVGVNDEGIKRGVVTAAAVVYIKVCSVATVLQI
jgi:hypothetical protein